MSKSRDPSLQKHTMNLRRGDFDKMGELFPQLGPSKALRQLVQKFVDKHYAKQETTND